MRQFFYFIIFYPMFGPYIMAQDERFYRALFSGTLKGILPSDGPEKLYKWRVHSPYYEVDLTGDGLKEAIVMEKKDGLDWLHIHDKWKAHKFSYLFEAQGARSKVYKINIRNISKDKKVIIIHYYEGKSDFLDFKGTARLYFLTFDEQKLKKGRMFKGPIIWHESENYLYSYHQRKYKLELYDYNKDGRNEILVKYNNISRVYKFYDLKGWHTL